MNPERTLVACTLAHVRSNLFIFIFLAPFTFLGWVLPLHVGDRDQLVWLGKPLIFLLCCRGRSTGWVWKVAGQAPATGVLGGTGQRQPSLSGCRTVYAASTSAGPSCRPASSYQVGPGAKASSLEVTHCPWVAGLGCGEGTLLFWILAGLWIFILYWAPQIVQLVLITVVWVRNFRTDYAIPSEGPTI